MRKQVFIRQFMVGTIILAMIFGLFSFTACGSGNDTKPGVTQYTVHLDDNINGGTVSATPMKAAVNKTITLSNIPDDDWSFSKYVVTKYDNSSLKMIVSTAGTFQMPAYDVLVSAEFTDDNAPEFAITKGEISGINGDFSIDPPDFAKENTEVTLTAYPDAGYRLVKFTVTGDSGTVEVMGDGDTRTFAMPGENVTVTATFILENLEIFAVILDTNIPNGSVRSSVTEAEAGLTISIFADPDSGYVLDKFIVTPSSLQLTGAGNARFFNMPEEDVTVSAVFIAIPTYTVTVATGLTGGTIAANPETAMAGTAITITATLESGYALQDVIVTPNQTVIGNSNLRTFTMPAEDVEVTATFIELWLPLPVIEDFELTPGPWVEGTNVERDAYYWRYQDTANQVTVFGTFTDSLGVSRKGTSFSATNNGNSFGVRYYRANGIINNRILDLSSYTHLSIWFKAENAPLTYRFQLDIGDDLGGGQWDHNTEHRYPQEFTVDVVDEWKEYLLPLDQFILEGVVVNPSVVGGWMMNQSGNAGEFWLSTITALKLP